MMRLNHRRWARLAAKADKCERRSRKNKAKTGLEWQIRVTPGAQIPAEVGKTDDGGVCMVRFSEPFWPKKPVSTDV
jgi:hypothetical protein